MLLYAIRITKRSARYVNRERKSVCVCERERGCELLTDIYAYRQAHSRCVQEKKTTRRGLILATAGGPHNIPYVYNT